MDFALSMCHNDFNRMALPVHWSPRFKSRVEIYKVCKITNKLQGESQLLAIESTSQLEVQVNGEN